MLLALSIIIAIVINPIMARAMGNAMFGATLDYKYNGSAVFIWLGIVRNDFSSCFHLPCPRCNTHQRAR